MPTTLPGITSNFVDAGIRQHYLEAGSPDAPWVVLVHGNVSSSTFWLPLMQQLASDYHVVAPDLRGYGDTEARGVDASRGVRDWSDDLFAFVEALGIDKAHFLGWSMGGGVVMQFMLDHPGRVTTLSLQAPVSPYGFGGTALDGSLLNGDASGTGGGGANPEFVANLKARLTEDTGPTSPRGVMKQFYVADPACLRELEDAYVDSMLSTVTGDDNYPGTMTASEHWPAIAPGDRGVLNTMSPKYFNTAGIVHLSSKPSILWIHGEADQIVGDASFFDLNTLGKFGVVPGWPGDEVAPPQPMITQTRNVLEAYAANGGTYTELSLPGCGHSPHLERPAEVEAALRRHFG